MNEQLNIKTIEEVKDEALASLRGLGIDVDNVQVLHANSRSLRDNGFLVDIDVSGTSMFETGVSWQLDLGISGADSRRATKRIRPGRKMLLPNNRLLSIVQRVRDNLYKYSHDLAVFPGYRYVPNSAFSEWHERHQELLEEFNAYKAELITDYAMIKDQCRQDFAKHARDTYPRLAADVRAKLSVSEFTSQVVASALASFPTKTMIAENLRIVTLPPATFILESEYQYQLLQAEQARTAAYDERLKRDAWAREDKAIADQQEAKAKTAQAEAMVAETEATKRAEVAAFQAEQEKQAIRTAQLEIARQAVKDMVNPYLDVINQNRDEVYHSVSKLAGNIRKRGWVHGKEAEKVRNLGEWFKLMNIGSDDQLAQALENLTGEVSTASSGSNSKYAYDADKVLTAMEQVIAQASGAADDLAEQLASDAFTMMDI